MLYITLISSVLNFLFAVYVVWGNLRKKSQLLFSILAFSASIVAFSNFMSGILPNSFWPRSQYAFGAIMAASGLVWTIYFYKRKFKIITSFLIYLFGITLAILTLVSKLVIRNIDSVYLGRFEGEFGPLFLVYTVFIFVVMVTIMWLLVLGRMRSRGLSRSQFTYILIGASIWVITSFFAVFLFPLLGFFSLMALDNPGSLVFISLAAYAILRHRLMDIRFIIARTIAFGSIVIILVALFSIFSAIIATFFESLIGFKSNILVGLILSILVVAGYTPLRKFIERSTDKFLFKKSYNPEELLGKISDASAAILDLQELLKTLSKLLNDALQFEKISFAFITPKGDLEISYKQGFKPGVAEGLAKYPDIVSILVKQLEETPGLLVIDEMHTRFENGEFKPVSPELLKTLHENNIAVVIPLYSKDDLIGLVVMGAKKSGDQYTQQDITTLDIFAGQAAVAIENARLYDELKYFNIKLAEEVKAKTAELRKANVQLKRLDQAKSDFISIASHQLRTPLTVIKGYISMMQEGSFGKVPKIIDKNLSKVYLSNERLIALVENLLDISRIESGRQEFEWTKVNLVDLASRLTGNLVNNAKDKGLKLIFHMPKEKIPIVIAEFNRLQDVMINFIDNAIKYTEKGKIDVTLEAKPEGMVTFCVKDAGRGIDPEVKDSLFKKFSRGKGSFQVDTGGSGLGLYVAKMVVEAHEGKIWAESKGRDKGAEFCFSIPIEGPKNRKDLPFAKPDQKVVDPVKSSAQGVPKLPEKSEKKK